MSHSAAVNYEYPFDANAACGSRRVAPVDEIPRYKRYVDCVLAGLLFVLLSPVLVVAVALVKLTSRGPGIYSQTRLGHNQRLYTLYKIRTMGHNCEAQTGPRWATRNDPRVTLVGRILRTTHVDELPQLWNVLRGEMSLVGPRPERPEIVKILEPQIPGYERRLGVLPGITGLAQIQLPPDTSTESVKRKLQYDVYYTKHVGPWLDVRLIVATAFKVFGLAGVARSFLRIPGHNKVEAADRTFGQPSEMGRLKYAIQLQRVGPSQPELSGA